MAENAGSLHLNKTFVVDDVMGENAGSLLDKPIIHDEMLENDVSLLDKTIVHDEMPDKIIGAYGVDTYFQGPKMAERMLDHILRFPPATTVMIVNGKDKRKIRLSTLTGLFIKKSRDADLYVSRLHRFGRGMRGQICGLRFQEDPHERDENTIFAWDLTPEDMRKRLVRETFFDEN